MCGKWGVDDYSKVFNLEIRFVQDFEGATVVQIVIK